MGEGDDAAQQKLFAVTTFEYLADIMDPPSLGVEIRKAADNVGQTNSLQVLRQVIRDLLEWTRELPPERVAELEARLARAKAPSLARMREGK